MQEQITYLGVDSEDRLSKQSLKGLPLVEKREEGVRPEKGIELRRCLECPDSGKWLHVSGAQECGVTGARSERTSWAVPLVQRTAIGL